jgi:prevent-host-death family protein
MKTFSAAEANRNFSMLLRGVKAGRSYVVTSHGRPVARIIPFSGGSHQARAAAAALFERLKVTPVASVGRWTRDELYEDGK